MAASTRLAATAERVASRGATAVAPAQTETGGGMRIGYLPLPGRALDAAQGLQSLLEDEKGFKLNAAVLKAADRMLQSLYDVID